MEIPKTLQPVWDKVAKDGVITKDDYDKLISAAAPTGKEEELDDSEAKFLGGLRSELEKSGGAKGRVPVEGLSFVQDTPPQVVKTKDLGDVPPTLKEAWNKAISDGKITTDEYKFLLQVASPNWSDDELDDKEKNFLGNLQALLKSSNGEVKFSDPKPETKTQPVKDTKAKPEPTAKQTTEKTNTQVQQPETKTQPQPEDNDDTPLDLNGMPSLKAPESDDNVKQLGKVKSILDSLGNDPDFTPLKGIVEGRISNNTSISQFNSDVKKIMSSIKPGKKDTLTKAKSDLQASYDKLSDGIKANPEVGNLFKYSMGVIDSKLSGKPIPKSQPKASSNDSSVPETLKSTWNAVKADGKIDADDYGKLIKAAAPTGKDEEIDENENKFLSSLKQKLEANNGIISFVDTPESGDNVTPDQPKNTTDKPKADVAGDLGKIPDTLKSTWDEISAKGEVNADDYSKLIQAAAPTGKDEELDQDEQQFLGNLKGKLEENNGTYSLNGDTPEVNPQPEVKTTGEVDSPTPKKPVLLNWPGYTDQTKSALKRAFGDSVTGDKMPILNNKAARDIVKAFGVSSITELQKKVHAKVDGKFGPETFFKAKVYVANEMNKPDANPENVQKMLNALGNDEDVQGMKAESGQKTDKKAATNDGVPDSLKETWKQITADGKVNAADYQKLMDAAAPNKKDEELDQDEINFLSNVKQKIEAGGGEMQVEPYTPAAESNSEPEEDNGVPASMKATWDQITADGKITADDYQKLMDAAAPNKKDEELDQDEINFLGQVKKLLEDNGGEVQVEKPAKTSGKTDDNADVGDGVPKTLKSTWDKVTADGKLTKADFDLLMKAAAPNKKNSEFDNDELEFLATIRDMFDKNNTDTLAVNKPQTKAAPQEKPESTDTGDGVPKTLKSTWDKVTADGKLTKADFDLLMKAAAPNKKNSEFDNDELEFLAAIRDMFDKNKTDTLEINKPAAQPQKTSQPTSSQAIDNGVPKTLKAVWDKITADGKITASDYQLLMKAAAPNMKNSEFDNDEIKFLAAIKDKLNANNGVINLKG